jgi:alpha-1,6-mannosyltransferase
MTLIALAAILESIFLWIALLGDLRLRIVETIGLLLLSGIFYLVCVFLILRPRATVRPTLILGAALLFRLSLWPVYPALSDDVFRYRWEGKLQAAGGNPYEVRPNDEGWRSVRDESFASTPGRDFRAVYGPLVEWIESVTYRCVSRFETRPYAQAFWFKVPSALFDLGVMAALWLLLKARGLPPERILIYAWSPLPLMEFWGTGHNDSIVLFFLVLALAAAARNRWVWAFAALAAAIASKIWPVFLVPLFLGAAGWRRWREFLVAVPIVAMLSLPYLPRTIHWSGVDENFRFLSGFLGGWRNNDSLFGALLWAAGNDFYLAKKMALGIVCVVVAAVTLLRWPLERAALAVIAVLLMVSANCHPWYINWMAPLLALCPVPPLLAWVALAPIAHAAVIQWAGTGEWNGSTAFRFYEYVPVYVLLLGWLACRDVRFLFAFIRVHSRPLFVFLLGPRMHANERK